MDVPTIVLPPSKMGKPRAPITIEEGSGCWVYGGKLDKDGYCGQVFLDGKRMKAHRAYYILAGGTIPAGMHLDHLCLNRACVRPDHMECITPTENQERRMKADLRTRLMVRKMVPNGEATVEEMADILMLPVHYIEAILRWDR